MKHIFIINPVSGTTNADVVLKPKIEDAAAKLALDYKIHITEYPGHAQEIAQEYAQSGEQIRLYACGGDGTLNEVLRGCLGCDNVEVGCVPCGSGNDFVRNFGSQQDFLDMENLIRGHAKKIDLIMTDRGIASAICSVGLDAQVAYEIPRFRRMPGMGGEMAYKLSIFTNLCKKMGHKLRIVADGEVLEDEYLMLAICNGVTYGGGFKASPEADMCDGVLELVTVKKISRLRIAGVVNTYKNGKHISNGQVIPKLADVLTYRKVKKVEIEVLDGKPVVVNQDGECEPRMGLKAWIKSSAVNVVLPESLCIKNAQTV